MADLESGGLDLELEGLGEVILVNEVKRGRIYENVEGVGGGGGVGGFGGGNHLWSDKPSEVRRDLPLVG
jgi:hypothetical protein